MSLAACSDLPIAPTTDTSTTPRPPVLQAPPTIAFLEPSIGSSDGGTTVRVTGTGFLNVSGVMFGDRNGTDVAVESPTTLTVKVPAGPVSIVPVVVTTSGGSNIVTDDSQFTWDANVVTVVTFDRTLLTGGSAVNGTVVMKYAAPEGGLRVPLAWRSIPAGSTSVVVPSTAFVPAGSIEGRFQVATLFVSSRETVEISTSRWGEHASAAFVLAP
ncbi:MAG: IPT/TIG domain-containing protein [Planctomycetes bacterium]|nr:IPT/TIG domain-containing protein [Planctomycetota bacterium]